MPTDFIVVISAISLFRASLYRATYCIGMTCNDRIDLIVVFKWFEFYRFLNMRKSLFFFFLKTVRIDPSTSLRVQLFIISHPVCDAIVRKWTKNVT